LSLLASGCGSKPRPDVFLITIDTLRPDRLGCYGNQSWSQPVSPALDAFAADAVLFTQAYAPRGLTLPSLTTLHTGVYPATHGVRENDQSWSPRVTLADVLGDEGYQTACFLSYLPGPKDKSIASAFVRREVVGRGKMFPASTMQARHDETALRMAIDYVARLGPPGSRAPAFVWLHLYDVHKPFTPEPPNDRLFDPDYQGPIVPGAPGDRYDPGDFVSPPLDRAAIEHRPLPERDHRHVLALYDGGVHGADARAGRLLAALKEHGLFDRALIAVASDHGDELGDHQDYYYHGSSVYDSVLHTVLILRPPGGSPSHRCEALVHNVDVMSTVLDVAGVTRRPSTEGISLAPALRGETFAGHDAVFAEWQDVISIIRTPKLKYIFNPRGAHTLKPPYSDHEGASFRIACEELYAIDEDPREQHNLAAARPEDVRALRERLRAFLAQPGHDAGMPSQFEGDEELRQLGYLPGGRRDVILGAEDCGEKGKGK
jgi:arylsulfatase A-like enzyme